MHKDFSKIHIITAVFKTNQSELYGREAFNTYLLGATETVCFVFPRLAMFPETQPRKTSPVEGSQNILLSREPMGFIIISHVKVNDSIKQDKSCFYCTYFLKKLNIKKRTK